MTPNSPEWENAVLVDSHCHLADGAFAEDRSAAIARARAAGVGRMVIIGTTPTTSRDALELASTDPGLFGTAGLHPHEAASFGVQARGELSALCERDDCVAVGETGLDWFKEWAPRDQQLASFAWHLKLARELEKPVVIHARDAHEDTARLVQATPGVTGVMHCFAMGPEEMELYLAAGLYISFSGIVTFPRSEGIQEAARLCPADRILVETDAPYLAPKPHRGKRCEPAHCADTLRFVAGLRGEEPVALAQVCGANAARLFRLNP